MNNTTCAECGQSDFERQGSVMVCRKCEGLATRRRCPGCKSYTRTTSRGEWCDECRKVIGKHLKLESEK
jgi:hypothetical protein